jgi:hypothetical protein
MTTSQTLRVRVGAGLASVALSLFAGVQCGGSVSPGTGTQPGPSDAQAASGSTSGAGSSGVSGSSSGYGSSSGSGSSGGSASSSGAQGASSGGSSSSGSGAVQPAPAGLAGFAFLVNGVEQTPLVCPAESWEYAPPEGQDSVDGSPGVVVCNEGRPPCPGLQVFLGNPSQYPLAYTAQTSWAGSEPPGVPFGNMGELSGVLNPGDSVDITSVYIGGTVAVLGSSHPFVEPDAGKYVGDGAMIPWPAGVAGSGGASEMYVAEIEIVESCRSPNTVW